MELKSISVYIINLNRKSQQIQTHSIVRINKQICKNIFAVVVTLNAILQIVEGICVVKRKSKRCLCIITAGVTTLLCALKRKIVIVAKKSWHMTANAIELYYKYRQILFLNNKHQLKISTIFSLSSTPEIWILRRSQCFWNWNFAVDHVNYPPALTEPSHMHNFFFIYLAFMKLIYSVIANYSKHFWSFKGMSIWSTSRSSHLIPSKYCPNNLANGFVCIYLFCFYYFGCF